MKSQLVCWQECGNLQLQYLHQNNEMHMGLAQIAEESHSILDVVICKSCVTNLSEIYSTRVLEN